MASHRLELTYSARWFSLGDRVATLLPRSWLRCGAALWGKIYAWTHPAKVAVVRQNLNLLGTAQATDAPKVYEEFAQVMVDYFYAGAHPVKTAVGLVEDRLGFEYLQAAHAAGRGALFLTPHLSFFELGGVVMQEIGYPMVALTYPEPSRALTEWRAAYRLRWGVETVEVGHDEFQFLQITKHLKAGKFVAALFDRPHPSQSFTANLPGGSLTCSTGVLLLALLARCPVIPVTVVVKANGRYRLEALPPINVERRGSTQETLQYYTQVLVDALRPTLAQNPTQWFQFASLH